MCVHAPCYRPRRLAFLHASNSIILSVYRCEGTQVSKRGTCWVPQCCSHHSTISNQERECVWGVGGGGDAWREADVTVKLNHNGWSVHVGI